MHLWGFLDVVKRGNLSVEPKVRLEGYGYNPFCSHSSRCLAVLVWQYFEEAFCVPKVRLKWYGFKGFPSHSSHCSGGLFPQYSGGSPIYISERIVSLRCIYLYVYVHLVSASVGAVLEGGGGVSFSFAVGPPPVTPSHLLPFRPLFFHSPVFPFPLLSLRSFLWTLALHAECCPLRCQAFH